MTIIDWKQAVEKFERVSREKDVAECTALLEELREAVRERTDTLARDARSGTGEERARALRALVELENEVQAFAKETERAMRKRVQ